MRKISCIALTLFLFAAAYAAAGAEGESAAAGDGPLVMSMFITLGERQQSMAPGENRYTDYLQEKFDVSFDLTVVPGEARLEKQNLLLASGTYPDIFFDGQFSPADQMKYGGQGVLIPINDLIANHGPDIEKAWELLPVLQKWMVTPDGNIYSIPAVEECYHCSVNQKHWINTTWLDKLGLDMPGTTDEYEAVLTAFRDDDPNGNGKQDEIPLTGAVNTWSADVQDFLMSAFIYTDGQRFLTADNGTIVFTPDKPEWRDGLRWINRLYTSGLIDSEAFTNSRDTLRALANRPDDLIVGAYAAGHALMGAQEEGIWQQYRVVPPLLGPGGVQLTAYRPYMPNFGRFAITNKASAAVQQRAMELANWFYTTEGTLEMGSGLRGPESEGFYWDWAGPDDRGLDGEPAVYIKLPPPPMSEVTNYKWHTEFRFWHKALFNSWAASQDIMTRLGYERFLVVESDKYIDHVPAEVVPGSMYFSPEDAQLTAQLQVEIQTYVEQNTVAFITGQRDLDTEWDSYVRGFEGLRLAHYLEVMQKTYDDFQ